MFCKSVFFALILLSQASSAVPQKFLDPDLRIPATKYDIHTYQKYGSSGATPFQKSVEWKACHQDLNTSRVFSAGQDMDSISSFLETNQVINRLTDMDKRRLLRGEVEVSPWSGDYWPYASGLLGARYRSIEFMNQGGWLEKAQYVKKNPMTQILRDQGQAGADILSPAEKYDLLTGSMDSTLTKQMWQAGQDYYERDGDVETWMGICHGWAPAAIMQPRPAKMVALQSLDQVWQISLLPSEIKGLISYNWATNRYPAMTLGARCQEKDPERDENGRIKDPSCQDLNPGIWHTVMVNMVGRQRRSFVMDATYDFEVWNQPIKSYSYTYFNPSDESKSSANFQDVIIERQKFEKDPWTKYRSAKTKYIIGVSMKLSYVSETPANENPVDVEQNDSVVWVVYKYDLELDENYKIIGGEWLEDGHPDFVWTPKKSAVPQSMYDYAVSPISWSKSDSLIPAVWAPVARQASSQAKVLNSIVQEINERAQE